MTEVQDMTELEETIEAVAEYFTISHISPHIIEDYPELKIVEPLKEPERK